MKQQIYFYGQTDLGKQRQNNEDNLIFQEIWDKDHILCIAIDGVGGYEGGEVAAEIAKITIVEYLVRYPNGERLVLLQQAVTETNNRIYEERQKQPKLSNMSCVLTACIVEVKKRQINMVHIGDSRLYQFHNGTLKKISHDHSHVGYREDIGDLTEEAAMNHPKRNEIDRLLGNQYHNPDDNNFLEVKAFSLLSNSILLLCSDGLTDLVTKAEISSILNQNILLENKVQTLIDLANKKGGKDNITVVLIDYQSDEIIGSIAAIENVSIETNSDKPNIEIPKKQKGRWVRMLLIAILMLMSGVIGGWITNDYISKERGQAILEDIANVKNNMLETDSLKIDNLNLTDTMAIKQYIQNLNDTIQVREQKIKTLKNVIQKLTETE